MDMVGKLRKFMKCIRRKYDEDDTFRTHGEFPWTLISQSGIHFGDGAAQLEAMELLLKHGQIEIVGLTQSKHVTTTTKIRPTLRGLEEKKLDWLEITRAVVAGVTEGVVKGFKG